MTGSSGRSPGDEPLVIDLEASGAKRARSGGRAIRARTAVALVGALGALGAVPFVWDGGGGSSAEPDDPVARGAELFTARGCASCHAGPDTDAEVGVGPPLNNGATWAGDRRPGMSAEEYLAESIRNPDAFISPEPHYGTPGTPDGGGGMPYLNVGDDEIDALVAYLLDR